MIDWEQDYIKYRPHGPDGEAFRQGNKVFDRKGNEIKKRKNTTEALKKATDELKNVNVS